MVTKASFAYPTIKLSEPEARVRLEVYADALSDIPADVLGAAFLEAIRTIKFFPSIAELRELARAEALRRHYAENPVIRAEPEPEREPLPEKERLELAEMMSVLARQMRAGAIVQ